ncbi:hypothetical protein D0Y65_008639 [Glycine soja]|uniref:Uncharacterized protein n=1 Tax=Glycine soja TaxID=3848 RepID=A0A445KVR3_GLYSO|nr:hypothetical protein D0Y65_008639 [Glycine soja]
MCNDGRVIRLLLYESEFTSRSPPSFTNTIVSAIQRSCRQIITQRPSCSLGDLAPNHAVATRTYAPDEVERNPEE